MPLIAYLDCSGDASDPQASMISVAGYIASADQWAEFTRQWSQALARYNVEALHMREFAHSVKRSAFEGWKGDVERRNGFMAELTTVIVKCDLQAVSTTLVLDAFKACNRDFLLRESFGPPYALALLKTVSQVVRWHERLNNGQPLQIILEKGDNEQSEFRKVISRLGEWDFKLLAAPVTQAKRWTDSSGKTQHCYPLQAADFLCYEHAKMFTDWKEKGKTTVRESIFRVSYPPRGDEDMSQLVASEWLRGNVHFSVTPRFNRSTDDTVSMPADPLCYLNMEQPLRAEINPVSWSKQAPRVVVEAIARVR